MKKIIAASAAALMLGGAVAPAMAGPIQVRTNINLASTNITNVAVLTQVAVAVGCLALCNGGTVGAGNFGLIIQNGSVVNSQN